jgi:hypothetical protein
MASVIHHRRTRERERERARARARRYKYGFPPSVHAPLLHLEILDGPPSPHLDLSSSLPLYRTRTSVLDRRAINKKKKKRKEQTAIRVILLVLRVTRARALGSRLAGLEGRGREGLGRAWKLRYSPHAEDEGESYVITTPALRHVETPQRFVPRFSANTRLS